MDGETDGQKDGWTHKQMDGHINESSYYGGEIRKRLEKPRKGFPDVKW